ncbi:MAG: formate dehydrogenase [Verrucomicrobia bacterium RIFCSPLOWO2_12_FULL_64_8]|nr:MAG: formate dehydrogenase [Verrucomicrobia bacterium RIFCSPLOWO2_12_FULL_64_8]
MERLARAIPFGLGRQKPKHFRDMLAVAWRNRDNLGYAWKVLGQGVCDGCALGVAGFHDWTIPDVHLCMTRLNLLRLNTAGPLDPAVLADVGALAGRDNSTLRELGRLPYPFLRRRGERGFSRVSWDEVYRRLGQRLRDIDPQRLAFYITARGVTNEVYYMAQKVARFLGTNHVDNAARLCHAPSTAAMKGMIGVAASTCSYVDWLEADVIVFFGANPANDQPVTTKYLLQAKRRGTRVILVNPYLEPGMKRYWVPSDTRSALFGSDIADHWFPVAQGGDIAFLYGTLKALLAGGGMDRAFIDAHTTGFESLELKTAALDWPALESASGLSRTAMEEFADLLARAKSGVVVWSMGITQQTTGADGVRMILNLALARGWIGRNGCGAMPIRGHSSVQGGAEMGCYATALPGGKPITPENVAALEQHYRFPLPRGLGYTTPEMIEAAHRGLLDVLYCAGGNLLRTMPDTDYVREALARMPVRVHQDIILTDQMLIEPGQEAWLLPAKTRYEQDGGGTETSTERRVMFSPELPRAVGEARAEWKILRDLAVAARPESAALLGAADGWALREEIARVVPFYDGIQHLQKTGDAFQYGGRHLCADGDFPLPERRALFATPPLPPREPADGTFHVSTRRGKQFNTLIYAEVDPLNGAGRDAVLMNADDAAARHLLHGDRVTLINDRGRFSGQVFFAPIAPGNLQIHWPEGNQLLPRDGREPASNTPDYTARVRLEREGAPAPVSS